MSESHQLIPGHFGPLQRGGRTRSGGWGRIGVLAGAFLAAVVLTASASAAALLWYGERSVTRVDIPNLYSPGDGNDDLAVDELTEVLNVLVVGDDSREGLTDEQLQILGTEEVDGGRTDTIMLLQLDPERDHAALLSFPRDLLVTRCDGSRGRINAAYGIGEQTGVGGGSCLVETVSDFTGIPIHHYVEVNFAGFVDVVDTLGGVTLYLDQPLRDRYAGLDLEAGCQELDGLQSLAFVRARRLDNDFGRMARQQRFIREVMNEVTSAGTLLNVPRMFSLVDAVGRTVETDRNLSLADMRRIAFSLRNLTADQLDTRIVPAVPRTMNGAALAVAKEDEAEELFEAFRMGTLAPEELGRELPQEVAVDDVPPVRVLNGAGIDGLAAQAADVLEDRGFVVSDTDNADHFDYEGTQVLHPPERREEAELLAAAVPGAEIVEGDWGDPLSVIVGADFDPQAAPDEQDEDPADPHDPDDPDPAGEAPDLPESDTIDNDFVGAESAEGRC